jgi:hypothetical protein
MIYAKKKNVIEGEFVALLETTKKLIIQFITKRKNLSPTDFETVVFKLMVEAAKGGSFSGAIYQTGTNAFPDIVAKKYFGVEVKMTTSNHWTSTGNSVLESSRIEDVERIYIMFGKFGGSFDIKYRLYQECLPEISVTHYPRYRINMDLPQGQSIFDKMGVDYDMLRKDGNPINTVKEYYKAQLKEGEELWWIDSEDKFASPVIRPHKDLSEVEKERFIVEAMIYFPEMFSNNATKFERAAAFLIMEYNAVSASLRDIFSAGGRVEIKVKRKKAQVPRIYHNMMLRSRAIKKTINTLDEEKLKHYWRTKKLGSNRLLTWKKKIDEKSSGDLPFISSDIFNSGL